jgi:hypothetical protein
LDDILQEAQSSPLRTKGNEMKLETAEEIERAMKSGKKVAHLHPLISREYKLENGKLYVRCMSMCPYWSGWVRTHIYPAPPVEVQE